MEEFVFSVSLVDKLFSPCLCLLNERIGLIRFKFPQRIQTEPAFFLIRFEIDKPELGTFHDTWLPQCVIGGRKAKLRVFQRMMLLVFEQLPMAEDKSMEKGRERERKTRSLKQKKEGEQNPNKSAAGF